ncbi:LysE/ArgO family amino acid transporter [Cellulomonas denverensis]|uniref:Amino acid transporter n=1 Tax=Cellulomonas denverensis TaxID=264297 RepID=A0A7X6KUY6_9CELL|nr:LysE/ArgO family amino acid transporter [Cellulomonas denverensis]NKY22310.1 amino acid transporter [Cellulomonas denverensis]GIG25861.1 amino acid transporter [Cellulomonas denverensis]
MTSLLAGLAFGLSLIVAIGAQNAFVLRVGLTRRQVLPVVAVCAISDLALIGAGVAGLGVLVDRHPAVLTVARIAGAAFLTGYAVLAIRRAVRPAALSVEDTGVARPPRLAGTVGTALALTWLNPHVYLDTVVLLGSVAAGYGELRWWFGAGAMLGSLLWFTALGYGARLLTPLFARPRAWRVLDGVIAAVMLAIAAGLLLGLRG